MDNKLNVGSIIRVKSKTWFEKNCHKYIIDGTIHYSSPRKGLEVFTESMSIYCNKEVTIKEVIGSNYKIEEDRGKYYWSIYMFDIYPYIDYNRLVSVYCNSQCIMECIGDECPFYYNKTYENTKIDSIILNKKDRVKIKSLESLEIYKLDITNTYIFPNIDKLDKGTLGKYMIMNVSSFKDYCGKEVVIREKLKDGNRFYYLIEGSDYSFPICMFDIKGSEDIISRMRDYCNYVCPFKKGKCIDECVIKGKYNEKE